MSSSRALASAQQRRAAGGQQTTSRPGTSIASQPSFAQQQRNPRMLQQQQQQINVPQQQVVETQSNGLPFSKLTVSDAIGLITLRLGRVEQFMLESEHSGNDGNDLNSKTNIPENSRLIDNSVLTSIINRLDSLEKKEINGSTGLNEQIIKLDKEVKETKSLLVSLLVKFETHVKETTEKFGDFDLAISEIEKSIQPISFINESLETSEYNVEPEVSVENVVLSTSDLEANSSSILSVDLKNIIKQELSNSNV
jgi:hypothetical protein